MVGGTRRYRSNLKNMKLFIFSVKIPIKNFNYPRKGRMKQLNDRSEIDRHRRW
jgi:hypothetical protein